MIAAARQSSVAQRRDMSRRVHRRKGCAAERFAAIVRRNDVTREALKDLQQQWMLDTEDVLFD